MGASIAFVTSFIRNMMGTGSLFAFQAVFLEFDGGVCLPPLQKDWAALVEPLGTGL